jgi:hypothetical protein
MRVHNKEIRINKEQKLTFEYLDALTREYGEYAIRFIDCGCDNRPRFLEVDFLDANNSNSWSTEKQRSIFTFRQRDGENTNCFPVLDAGMTYSKLH